MLPLNRRPIYMLGLYSEPLDLFEKFITATLPHAGGYIVYTRPNPEGLNRLTELAEKVHPVKLVGGITLHGGTAANDPTKQEVWDYITDTAVPISDMDHWYSLYRWEAICNLCLDLIETTGNSSICLVSEPDPLTIKLIRDPRYIIPSSTRHAVIASYQRIWNRIRRSATLYLDQPTMPDVPNKTQFKLYAQDAGSIGAGRLTCFMPLEAAPTPRATGPELAAQNNCLTAMKQAVDTIRNSEIWTRSGLSTVTSKSFPWSPADVMSRLHDSGTIRPVPRILYPDVTKLAHLTIDFNSLQETTHA